MVAFTVAVFHYPPEPDMNTCPRGATFAAIAVAVLAFCIPFANAAAPSPGGAPAAYVDARGNPLPSPDEGLVEINTLASQGKLREALEKTERLSMHPELTETQRTDLLYKRADLLFLLYRDDPIRHLTAIVDAGTLAVSRSPDDPRNGEVFLRLGYANLRAGNIPEARAWFAQLRKHYPRDENISFIHFYWGEWHHERGELREAAAEFRRILEEYPGSKPARDAAFSLALIQKELGEYAEADGILTYVEKTWPRAYLDRPDILLLAGDVAFHREEYATALGKYMLYYNLDPKGPDAAKLLTRMGDAHTRAGRLDAAKRAYQQAALGFPGTDGGRVGQMRLAELDPEDAAGISGVFSSLPGYFSEYPAKTPEPAVFHMGDATILALQDTPGSMDTTRFSGADKVTLRALEPGGRADSSVNAYLVQTGGKNILIDTGFGGNGADRKSMLLALLREAGVPPQNIDTVLLTHLHLDHAGGLLHEGGAAFPKALVLVSKPELAYWTDARYSREAPGLQKNFTLVRDIARAYGSRLRTFAANDQVAPGITAVAAAGHTPGHTAFLLATDKGRVLFLGDTVQAASLQFPHPEIYAPHDLDGGAAVTSRLLLLGLAGAEGVPVAGTHLPFPGVGRVTPSGSGYAFTPGL